MLASRMRLVVGSLWTFLNSVAIRRSFPRLWETSAGDLWRFELVFLFALWLMAASAILGVLIFYDLRLASRHKMNGAHLFAGTSLGEGSNV